MNLWRIIQKRFFLDLNSFKFLIFYLVFFIYIFAFKSDILRTGAISLTAGKLKLNAVMREHNNGPFFRVLNLNSQNHAFSDST